MSSYFDALVNHKMQEINRVLQEEIQKEIQRELFLKMMLIRWQEAGWITIKLSHDEDRPLDWIQHNIQGAWDHFDNYYFFELESDATMFALKWSGNANLT